MPSYLRVVAFDYPPAGWLFCDGSELNQYQERALFEAIGTRYGGDGKDSFKLPDLRDALVVGPSDKQPAGRTSQLTRGSAGNEKPHGYLVLNYIISTSPQLDREEAYLGEVRLFAGGYDPRHWSECDGRSVNLTTNTALFALLGDRYGGDAKQTFKLPDLRRRAVVGAHQDRRAGNSFGYATEPAQGTPAFLGLRYMICHEGMFPGRG